MNRREQDQLSNEETRRQIEERYPISVVLCSYVGDWNLGSSRTEIRFTDDPEMPYTEAVIVHVYSDNNPCDHSPPWSRLIFLEAVENHTLRELRGAINKVLGE